MRELPAAIVEVLDLFREVKAPWSFCGGWAVDLFAGPPFRQHKDVDVAVWRCDQLDWQSHLQAAGFELEIASDGVLSPWRPRQELANHEHTIWCRRKDVEPGFVELLFNDVRDGTFRFRRDPSLTMPEERALVSLSAGVTVLAPEICLLYKAPYGEPEHQADFDAAWPHLNERQRRWLSQGLKQLYPGHRWLDRLSID